MSISFAVLAAVAGVFVLYLAHRARSRLSLPAGEIVYQDLGGKVSQVRTLVSPQLRLSGKPDLLIETPEGMVPLELKHSGVAPRGSEPYENHRAQLLAYCILVEEVFNRRVPYGIVRYRGQDDRIVQFECAQREWLTMIVGHVHAARNRGEVHRNHNHPGRCSGCGPASQCGEALS